MILEMKKTYNIEEEKSYLIYMGNADINASTDYVSFICKYDFRSIRVKVIRSFDELKSMNEINNYHYLIILESDNRTDEFIDTIKGDKSQNVIRFY